MQEALRVEAQRNEYMFALMREHGVADRLDQNVGVDFINTEATNKALETEVQLSSTDDSSYRSIDVTPLSSVAETVDPYLTQS